MLTQRACDTLRVTFYGFAMVMLMAGCDGGHQRPDITTRPELERLYDFLFDEAAEQIGHDLRTGADELGRDRVINAANSLVDDAISTPKPVYEIDLPYLWAVNEGPIAEQGPRDFHLEITHEQLVELGAVPGG